MEGRKIELSDISVLPLYKKWMDKSNWRYCLEYYNILMKLKELDNYAEVEALKIDYDLIKESIETAKRKIEIANNKGAHPVIYHTKENLELPYNYSQKNIDKNVTGDILLIGNPLKNTKEKNKLQKYSLYEMKNYLSHCKFNGKNTLESDLGIKRDGFIDNLIYSINFYNEHILRLVNEYPYLDPENKDYVIDEFHFQIYQLLREQKVDIIKYLIKNAECFGTDLFTKEQKEALRLAIHEYTSYDRELIHNLISSISNYVTYNEAKEGLVKTKALDRFIKKNNK